MDQDITLREAFERFHHRRNQIVTANENEPDSERFFNSHDVAHVVFGCDSSLRGEGIVKLWTIFGTTLGFAKHIEGYKEANAFALFREYRLRHVLMNVPKVLAAAPLVIARARKMSKKWPWKSYDQYLDTPIREIRREFNIVPIAP
ncbi:MAG: hypothetical protein AAF438_05660 [Pseudomonadota bacterium]